MLRHERVKEIRNRLNKIKKRLDVLTRSTERLTVEHYDTLVIAYRQRGSLGARTRLLKSAEKRRIPSLIELRKAEVETARSLYTTTWNRVKRLRERLVYIHSEIIKLVEERKILEEELKKLAVEFVDIDEDTGYLIMHRFADKLYYLVTIDEYKAGKIYEPERLLKTIEITVNFTFETVKQPKYEGEEPAPEDDLEAEIRITVRVREAGSKLVTAIVNKLKLAYEAYVTDMFETKARWKLARHIIADAVDVKRDSSEYFKKIEKATALRQLLPELGVIKVGAYFRINDEPPTVVIEEEYAKAIYYGEWTRGRGTYREHSEGFIDFELDEYWSRPLEWNWVRYEFIGETGFEQLKRVKGEETVL